MGWYLKKSVAIGPLRLNLSKSGLGVSAGVKGLRVSTGPSGARINAGRGGLYYRASLNRRPKHAGDETPLPEGAMSSAQLHANAAAQSNGAEAFAGSGTPDVAGSVGRQGGLSLLRAMFGGLIGGR